MSFRAGIRHIRVVAFVFCVAFMLIMQSFTAQCDEEEQTEYNDITVRFEEENNGPSSNKKYYYLDMVVRLEGAEPNTEYMIDFSKAEYTYTQPYECEAKTNPVSVTTDRNGSAEVSFALKHGQEFTICDLPEGTFYAVSDEYDGDRMNDEGEIKNKDNAPFVPDKSIEQIPGYEDSKEGILNGKDIRVSFLNFNFRRYNMVTDARPMFQFQILFYTAGFIVIMVLTLIDYRAQKKYVSERLKNSNSDTEEAGSETKSEEVVPETEEGLAEASKK